MNKLDFGKYRGIIISIVLFLILDASVLIMNFYISFEIADDAVGVNIAGRQRMLSQRMMKSLFDIQTSLGDEAELQRSVAELQATTNLFNQTLIAFDKGGLTKAPDGNPATLEAVSSPSSLQAVAEGKDIWQPYFASINRLLALDPVTQADDFSRQLMQTIDLGQASNLTLLALMNKLTGDLEKVASSKADTLRLIQTVGISLAIINFFIIMFHSIRQLRDSDHKIEAAQNETREILDTVNEGLFLLDKDGLIGDQYSAELETIMGRDNISGLSMNNLLKTLVSGQTLTTTEKFVGLLFDPAKKEKLLGSLNPLKEVEVHISNEQGAYESKFLSFAFSRVLAGKEILHILVTVKDITQQVLLARELEAAQKQGEQQFEMLTSLMSANSSMIPMYLDNSQKTLHKINEILRQPTKKHSQLINKANEIFRLIHGFKGESAALDMQQFADMAHQFEDQIDALKRRPELSGNDFLPLTIMLNKIISQLESTAKIMQKITAISANASSNETVEKPVQHSWEHLAHLTSLVAERQHKQVELIHSGLSDHLLPDDIRTMINTVSIQLIRNSITHGIESPAGRFESQKDAQGVIDIRLVRRSNGEYQYSFSDDGKGLDLEAIRTSAIKKGLITEEQSEGMDKKQIISLIFSPQISTSESVDEDSGRGAGMASVQQAIRELGGKLSISSRRGLGCSFTINLPASALEMAQAA